MNNSYKTSYLIAIFAIALLILNIFVSIRFYNGYNLNRDALIGFNVSDPHGVSITRDAKFVSFESGFVFDVNISELPLEEGNIVSLAIPVNNLEKNSAYNATVSFNLYTNTTLPITIESNATLTPEDIIVKDNNFPTKTISAEMRDYDINVNFGTNELGTGYIIINIPVDNDLNNLHFSIDNMQIKDFKETENAVVVETESESEVLNDHSEE